MAQSSYGKIRVFDDFIGGDEVPIASSTAPPITFGAFQAVGQGLAENDSGLLAMDADGLNGVVNLRTTNEDIHASGLASNVAFDVGLMGTISLETRLRVPVLANTEVFVGFSDVQTDLAIIEGAICHGAGTTLTLTASDIGGFLLSSDLTDSTDWHAVYNGGTTTGETTSTSNDFDSTITADEFVVLRIEIANNGNTRWYVNGEEELAVAGAVSTSADLGALVIVEAKTTTITNMEVDYIAIEANRDWTV